MVLGEGGNVVGRGCGTSEGLPRELIGRKRMLDKLSKLGLSRKTSAPAWRVGSLYTRHTFLKDGSGVCCHKTFQQLWGFEKNINYPIMRGILMKTMSEYIHL